MSKNKHAKILAVSEGWENAYILQDERTKWVYYVEAPHFKKMRIEETHLRSSLAYELLVPEKQDFPSVDAALEYVKSQYETQDDTLISFSEAAGVILDYAKAINHPLLKKTANAQRGRNLQSSK